MNILFRTILAGSIAGLIGAAAWAGISYSTGYEIGWIAWGIGLLVGIAIAAAAGERSSRTGALAAGITIIAIVGGKYATAQLWVDAFADDMTGEFAAGLENEEYLVSFIADDVVAEWQQAGRELTWPEDADLDHPAREADYPADVWAEASTRWDGMSADEQTQYREGLVDQMRADIAANSAAFVEEGFLASFALLDIVFFGLGIITAYSIGSGRNTSGE